MISYSCPFNHGVKFHDSLCNGCHDLMILFLNISDISVVTVKGVNYVLLFMVLSNLNQFSLVRKLCASKSWICIKIHFKEINIKNWVYNYYLNNLVPGQKV